MFDDEGALVASERETDIQWLDTPGHWLEPRWRALVGSAAAILGIEVDGEPVSLQVARYRPGHQYGWHQDVDLRRCESPERKLSVAALLRGPPTLELSQAHTPALMPGDALAFPAWHTHRVSPNDEERYSLTGWLTGPRWR